MSNGHESSSYSISISKSGSGTSSAKRLQRAALPTEWLAAPQSERDENSLSQVSTDHNERARCLSAFG